MKHETRIAKLGIAKRRGAFSTFPGADWSACLVRTNVGDLVASLGKCHCVASIEDVTDSVYDGTWMPPNGMGWSLLVVHKHQDWCSFADIWMYNRDCDRIASDFDGEVLRTGHRDDIAYVRLWVNGKQRLEFVTDGAGFPMPPEDIDPDDDEDYRNIYDFETDLYDGDFPHTFKTIEEAHQQLIIDRDAYVAGITFDDGTRDGTYGLSAGYRHDAAVDRKNVTAVYAVTFTQDGG
ncbi:hypothetical protein Poly51_02230 [Rubripirellula tenax]|uniref:Uncharacterized protein n=1 Tax=Rubripirellula tenax TaxID=2528015 RepID=A0A5C6FGJ2_9BACT|nr:hypothetical protein [Rubripirellula tenax]TWU59950.1 hypothetical protein Poly51_02230 [Rubripirellula tenax]